MVCSVSVPSPFDPCSYGFAQVAKDQGLDRYQQSWGPPDPVLGLPGRETSEITRRGSGGRAQEYRRTVCVGKDHPCRLQQLRCTHNPLLSRRVSDPLSKLIRYFTCGPDEVRAWTIRKGIKAPQAAGVIQYVSTVCCRVVPLLTFDQFGLREQVCLR